MFDFFKKKKRENNIKNEETVINEKEILKELEKLEEKLNGKDLEDKELSKIYEQMGLLYKKMDKTDVAIEIFEKSLKYNKNLGEGYKNLLNLYNMKRAEAARNGNDDMIQKWLLKFDEMMQLSKDITRGKY